MKFSFWFLFFLDAGGFSAKVGPQVSALLITRSADESLSLILAPSPTLPTRFPGGDHTGGVGACQTAVSGTEDKDEPLALA